MRYNGGKKRVSGQIADIINRESPSSYWEPFCGMCWVGQKIHCAQRTFSDASMATIAVLKAAQSGLEFPTNVTENQYRAGKSLPEDDPMHGFMKFGCSFGGKPWGGMARGEGRNYAAEASRSLSRIAKSLQGAEVQFGSYDSLDIEADVVYCDPPYKGTTDCGSAIEFDHDAFWRWVSIRSQSSKVFISEYDAPAEFKCIWEAPVRGLRRSSGVNVEKLFILS